MVDDGAPDRPVPGPVPRGFVPPPPFRPMDERPPAPRRRVEVPRRSRLRKVLLAGYVTLLLAGVVWALTLGSFAALGLLLVAGHVLAGLLWIQLSWRQGPNFRL